MNQTTTAGIDLDKYDAEEIIESPALHGAAFYLASDVEELLARRAEPSVTAADERALPPLPTASARYYEQNGYRRASVLPEKGEALFTADQMRDYARAALASPAVSQKDGAAVEPIGEIVGVWLRHGEAVIRLRGEAPAVGTLVYATPAATTASPFAVFARNRTLSDDEVAAIPDNPWAATTTSACNVCNGTRCVHGVIGDPPEECEACADQQPAEATTASASDPYDTPLDIHQHIAKQIYSRAPAPSRDAAPLDVRAGFEKWMSDRGDAANYAGDGMYESPSVNRKAEAFRAGVEYAALARAPLPAQGEPVYFYRQKHCGGSWIETDVDPRERFKNSPAALCMEYRTLYAAPTQAGDARDVALRKINDIRNSIIGLQTLNWSEHVYPLVAALDAAGYEGMGYPEARKYHGTLLERAVKAEDALAAMSASQDATGGAA